MYTLMGAFLSCLPYELFKHCRPLLNGGYVIWTFTLPGIQAFSPVLHTHDPLKSAQAHQKLAYLYRLKPSPTPLCFLENCTFSSYLWLFFLTFFFLIHAIKKGFQTFTFICFIPEDISLHISKTYSAKWNSSLPLKLTFLVTLFHSAWSSSMFIFISHSSCLHRFHAQ